MKSLSEFWFTEGKIDFELKKYQLLAYLQEINLLFHKNRLYPQLGELIFHYSNLQEFKKNKDTLQQNFPQRLSSASIEKIKLVYQKIVADDTLMDEIENIIQFSVQQFDHSIQEGKEIYNFVEEQLIIQPVGLMPIQTHIGYLFISEGECKEINVYEYQISLFERMQERYQGINTTAIGRYQRSFVNTYEQIKIDLIRSRKELLPNPAVFSIETSLSFPIQETLLPIAKRTLVKYIAQGRHN